jgi:putative transposase
MLYASLLIQPMPFTRKIIRLSPDNYSGIRSYFVTICCQDRRPLLRDAGAVSTMLTTLRDLSSRHEFAVHAYCFMPDHLHLLCEGLSHESRLLDFVGRFKQQTAFEHRRSRGATLWQSKFYDHILRQADAMDAVAWYIWMNPVRKGLCSDTKDFPFSGSLTLPWKEASSPTGNWTPPWKHRKTGDAGLKPGATQA